MQIRVDSNLRSAARVWQPVSTAPRPKNHAIVRSPRTMTHIIRRIVLPQILALAGAATSLAQTPTPGDKPASVATPSAQPKPDAGLPRLKSFAQDVPAANFKFDMVLVPGDESQGIKPFYMSAEETRWEAYDVFVYRLDDPNADPNTDVATRPSKPYLPPDRGFGHEGFAAISIAYNAAVEYCAWLSKASGRHYRLPTEAEWEYAARAGAPKESDLPAGVTPETLGDFAVFTDNSNDAPKPAGSKKPNAYGLYDMLGNIAEWCTDAEGKPITKGGNYLTVDRKLTITARVPYNRDWQTSDPQIPKSKWWLSDGPFVGFRVICDEADAPKSDKAQPETPPRPAPNTNSP